MSRVEWRIKRQPDGVTDDDLYDIDPSVRNVKRNADHATILLQDPDEDKDADYPRGQRVDLEVSTDGGSTFSRVWAGWVQDKGPSSTKGAGLFELNVLGYDHYLTTRGVYKDYSSTSILNIVKDIVQNFTPIRWNADNVDLVNPDTTLTRSFKGETPEDAIQFVLQESANEDFGVNNDFEFEASPRETREAPGKITNSDWIDYDLPEEGRASVNRVELFYGESGNRSRVVVEDRGAQQQLKDDLDAASRVVRAAEPVHPEISDEAVAESKARQILSGRSPLQTGKVWTTDRYDWEPGDVFPLTIKPADVDGDFRVAQIEHYLLDDLTLLIVAENSPDVESLLVALSDEIQRISRRDADPDATFTQFLDLDVGINVDLDVRLRKRTAQDDLFAFGEHYRGFGEPDLGGKFGARFGAWELLQTELATVTSQSGTTSSVSGFIAILGLNATSTSGTASTVTGLVFRTTSATSQSGTTSTASMMAIRFATATSQSASTSSATGFAVKFTSATSTSGTTSTVTGTAAGMPVVDGFESGDLTDYSGDV